MGLSIHYNGKFKKSASLAAMIEELQDVAIANEWKSHVFETSFDAIDEDEKEYTLYGIILNPPECEPVQFIFLRNRRMCSLGMLAICKEDKKFEKHLYQLFTKTQYAGIEIHKQIIHLFRYISAKYFEKFEMVDEGYYWETNDEHKLKAQFDAYIKFTDMISLGLQAIPIEEDETIENYIKRVVGKVRDN